MVHGGTKQAELRRSDCFVQLDGEAFADEFALVTEQGAEDELLRRADELAGVLPCGAPIRYLTL